MEATYIDFCRTQMWQFWRSTGVGTFQLARLCELDLSLAVECVSNLRTQPLPELEGHHNDVSIDRGY